MGTAVAGPPLANVTTGCSPVTDIPNPNATGGATEWIYAGVQTTGLGNLCASGGCILNLKVQPWTPSTPYAIGQQVLDTHFHLQVVRVAGTSRTAALGHPNWAVATDGSTTDASVRWTNQGAYQTVHQGWQASHAYAVGIQIVDSNGNIQWVATAGTSKAGAHPVWNLNVQGQTADNTVRWRNLGPSPPSALPLPEAPVGLSWTILLARARWPGLPKCIFRLRATRLAESPAPAVAPFRHRSRHYNRQIHQSSSYDYEQRAL